MLDFERIVSAIQGRSGCSRDEAWSALSEAYLTLDRDAPEAQQAAYLIKTSYMRFFTNVVKENSCNNATAIANATMKALRAANEDNDISEDDLFVSKPEIEDDNKFIVRMVREVPATYKLGLFVVLKELLKQERKRGNLSVEMTRQYLKKYGINNTVEVARQIFTFLTTRFV